MEKIVKIIYIDDESMNREVFRALLKRINAVSENINIILEEYSDSSDFIDKNRSSHFNGIDLLFTDWQMPNLNGGELIEIVREVNQKLQIWIVSSLHRNAEISRFCLTNNCRTLPKPVIKKELAIIINQYIREIQSRLIMDQP